MDQAIKPYTHSISDILVGQPPKKKQDTLTDVLNKAATPDPHYKFTLFDLLDSPSVPRLFFQKLNCMAISPARSTPGSAGLDLFSPYTVALGGNEQRLIPTHLRFVIPKGYYGRVACTSGNCYKFRLSVGAGVIDQDYDGDVGVLLANNSNIKPVLVQRGQKIAQLILEKITIPRLCEISHAPEPERVVSFGRRKTSTPQRHVLRKL